MNLMKRQLFCYITYIIEIILLISFVILIINKLYIDNIWIIVLAILLLLNIFPLLFSFLFFGTQNNFTNKSLIKNISIKVYNELKIITAKYYNKQWILYYDNKEYLYDFKYWFNNKQRLIDFVYIQFHNYYFNYKCFKNKDYYKKISQ